MQAAEIDFFRGVLDTIDSDPPLDAAVGLKFQQHIDDIENRYHRDTLGGFRRLWPELAFLLGE